MSNPARGKGQQIGRIVRRQAQDARERLQQVRRNMDLAPLLKPGVPRDSDSANLRKLFAKQPWGAPPP
jgi:hypothetical protein